MKRGCAKEMIASSNTVEAMVVARWVMGYVAGSFGGTGIATTQFVARPAVIARDLTDNLRAGERVSNSLQSEGVSKNATDHSPPDTH